jgi:two-component system, NarL family, nitrate/nitrite response regulator NarL
MRVVIVGPAEARARLASRLPEGIEVVAEARTTADARNLGLSVDALILTPFDFAQGKRFDFAPAEPFDVEPLTSRELEVVAWLAQGLPNKAIAARLGISDQTVKFHVASICGKLAASNRTEAARKALRLGLIPL